MSSTSTSSVIFQGLDGDILVPNSNHIAENTPLENIEVNQESDSDDTYSLPASGHSDGECSDSDLGDSSSETEPDETSSEDYDTVTFQEKLANWATSFNVSQSCLAALLSILRLIFYAHITRNACIKVKIYKHWTLETSNSFIHI